jgi:CreA protein
MRAALFSFALLFAFTFAAHAQTRIDSINTNFRWLGTDDKIIVERYDDPKVTNVSCYMSRAETGVSDEQSAEQLQEVDHPVRA